MNWEGGRNGYDNLGSLCPSPKLGGKVDAAKIVLEENRCS